MPTDEMIDMTKLFATANTPTGSVTYCDIVDLFSGIFLIHSDVLCNRAVCYSFVILGHLYEFTQHVILVQYLDMYCRTRRV